MGLIDVPPFRPRPPWLGPDLQTLRNFIRRPRIDLSHWPMETLSFAAGDGDRLTGVLHRGDDRGKPLALLIHGLTGCADSTYVRQSARHLLGLGYSVLRLNLRGAGDSWHSCALRYHAGRTDDLRKVLAALPPGVGVVAVGYSLGANIVLKYLGEEGAGSAIRAAVAVSAPISLRAATRRMRMPRNRLYHTYLLQRMKVEALRPNAALTVQQRAAVTAARSIYDYDDCVIAPVNGFTGAEDYYARCSAGVFLPRVAVPTLVIHSLDDPWIPSADYAMADWTANANLQVLLPGSGGHVGFHGIGTHTPWHDLCAERFFGATT